MHLDPTHFSACLILVAVFGVSAPEVAAQQPIGRTTAAEVQVAGSMKMDHGEMLLGNGSVVTAGSRPVKINLIRGGELRLCSTTSVHLAKDRSVQDPADNALMMALDRGALEANYQAGKYSDVLLTPDLRILISGPGEANLSIRVNSAGDTCVDNYGLNAPYVTVSSQLEGGAYRVRPNQRVLFEHGSLREVVDNEMEPCGCPAEPVVLAANTAALSANRQLHGKPIGGPSSTPADTAFPLKESEGLAHPPAPPETPVVPPGEAHAEVTVPLNYSGENPPAIQPDTPNVGIHGGESAAPGALPNSSPSAAAVPTVAAVAPVPAPVPAAPLSTQPAPAKIHHGVFHRIAHFFSRLFG